MFRAITLLLLISAVAHAQDPAPRQWSRAGGTTTTTPPPSAAATSTPPADLAGPEAQSRHLTDDMNIPLPVASPALKSAATEIAPLTPDEVREMVKLQDGIDRALAPAQVVPRISSLTVDLAPGASLPLLRTSPGHTSNISLIDSTGAPWPVELEPINSAEDAFDVRWVPGLPVISVQALRPYRQGNLTLSLPGLNVPVVVSLTSGEASPAGRAWTVDSRLDLRIPRRGSGASEVLSPASKVGLYNSTLQAFLDGIPPANARRLKTSNSVEETTVWQIGDDLYVRSRAMLRDEFEETSSSADGMRLWKLPLSPLLTFSVAGRSVPLQVHLE
ncbi:DotH/IcmK family type IV secretion protein [Klebsiella pneumoniae]|nr:conjugal transfer protein TraN [Klebsiella pneumoniae]HEC2094784.1 conjugal transfer protein TraN [Klebsiella oxytoca]